MSVEDYKFIPPDESPKNNSGKDQFLPDHIREYYARQQERSDRLKAEGEQEKKKELKWTTAVCGGFALLLASSWYARHNYGQEQAETSPSGAYWAALEKSGRLTGKRKADLEQRLNVLREKMGEKTFVILNRQLDYAKLPMPSNPAIKGFDKLGLAEQDVAPLFSPDLFPRGTINGNIQEIVYDGEFYNTGVQDEKGLPQGAAGQVNEDNTKILFHRYNVVPAPEDGRVIVSNLAEVASHEIAHKRSGNLDFSLTAEQRINFLFEALDVYINSNEYGDPSGIMEFENAQIEKNVGGIDSKLKVYAQVEEWWANLCTEATNHPKQFFNEASEKEIALVKKWFVRGDKKFDFYKTNELRAQRQKKLDLAYRNAETKRKLKLNRR